MHWAVKTAERLTFSTLPSGFVMLWEADCTAQLPDKTMSASISFPLKATVAICQHADLAGQCFLGLTAADLWKRSEEMEAKERRTVRHLTHS